MKPTLCCTTLFTLALLLTTSLQAHPSHTHDDEPQQLAQADRPFNNQRSTNRPPRHMEPVELPEPIISITIEGDTRVIRANGLPNHQTGDFPNNGNPNAIRPQNHEFRLPLNPTISDEPTSARPQFGVALNGVIFDAGTAEFWTPTRDRAFGGRSPWNYEALTGGINLGLDQNNAHVQPTGKYHYHGIPTGLIQTIAGEQDTHRVMHLGWALDGFPIYGPWGYDDPMVPNSELRQLKSSYQLKQGHRPASPQGPGGPYDGTFGLDFEYVPNLGDLDECNGRFGVTPEFPNGTYYYVITQDFPSIPRMWRGQPPRRSPRGFGPPR
ncbi:MAG: YHYH protein [Phycisphaeraceae bacterium]